LIINYLKAQPYKNAISNSRRFSASSTGPVSSSVQRGSGIVVCKGTKPTFLLVNGDHGTTVKRAEAAAVITSAAALDVIDAFEFALSLFSRHYSALLRHQYHHITPHSMIFHHVHPPPTRDTTA
jgi:hypothetical protein